VVEKKSHYHSLRRVRSKPGAPVRYMCTYPYCSFVAAKELLHNKFNICPFCNTRFQLTWADLRKAVPHCGCKAKKDEREIMIMPADMIDLMDLLKNKEEQK
jgi:hypothetical protein